MVVFRVVVVGRSAKETSEHTKGAKDAISHVFRLQTQGFLDFSLIYFIQLHAGFCAVLGFLELFLCMLLGQLPVETSLLELFHEVVQVRRICELHGHLMLD